MGAEKEEKVVEEVREKEAGNVQLCRAYISVTGRSLTWPRGSPTEIATILPKPVPIV